MIYAIFVIVGFVVPWAMLKAYEIYQVKKNKKWNDEPIEHIDLWEYPSNFYKGGKR